MITLNGESVVVEDIRRRPVPERVYNLKVTGLHTYFVGQGQIWVHNADTCPPRIAKTEDAVSKPLMDQMSIEEAKRYRGFWEQHAPEKGFPYDRYPRYTEDGRLKQVTTYDQFGDRHRQYDLIDSRHGEHQHNFNYDSEYSRPRGRRTKDHPPIDE